MFIQVHNKSDMPDQKVNVLRIDRYGYDKKNKETVLILDGGPITITDSVEELEKRIDAARSLFWYEIGIGFAEGKRAGENQL